MKTNCLYGWLIVCALSASFLTESIAQISKEGCFDSNGRFVPCGGHWTAVRNGVSYDCVCNCSGSDQCTQGSSSSSSGSGSSDYTQVIMGAVIEGLFNNLNKWLNSPSQPSTSSSTTSVKPREMTEAEKRELERKREEYRQKVQEQINNASSDYSRQISEKFADNKEATLNDFKTKMVKSESVKSIKQLNCAAYNSIEAARLACQTGNFNSPEGSLEQARQTADFASGASSNCPEIKISIPDVTVEHPKGFQQSFYETVKFKSDSITRSVTSLKETHKEIRKKIDEKEVVIERLKSENQSNDTRDPLMEEALKALNEAVEEEKKVSEEIVSCQKKVELYDIMRSSYDVDKSVESNKTNESK